LYDEVKTKTWLETTYQTFPSYPVDEALKEFTLKPFQDQRDFLEDYSRIKYGFQLRGCLLDAAVGSGKANPLSTKIKIPGGWTTMGKIKVGDVITGADGLPTTVLATFPQGEQDIYKFTFHDGRVAEATLDHVWTVWQESHSGGYWKTMTTKEIIEKREISPHFKNQTHIPLIKPELVEDKKYVIDPYAMGALLGDGGFTGGGISFTNSDEFVVNKLRERLGDHYLVKEKSGYRKYSYRVTTQPFRASLQSVLKELELINKLSVEKHIPEEMMNEIEDKLDKNDNQFDAFLQQNLSKITGTETVDNTLNNEMFDDFKPMGGEQPKEQKSENLNNEPKSDSFGDLDSFFDLDVSTDVEDDSDGFDLDEPDPTTVNNEDEFPNLS
jgi:hypothetical protein